MENYQDLELILDNLGFDDFFTRKFFNAEFEEQIRNKKDERRKYNGLVEVANSYATKSPYGIIFDSFQGEAPNKDDNIEKDFEFCVKVLDWGGVTKSNLFQVIEFYKKGELSEILKAAKKYFEDDTQFNCVPSTLLWSSGWTKIYSLISNETLIYDSRVCAFLNHIMYNFIIDLTREEKEQLLSVTKYLFSFGGANNRHRKFNSSARDKLGMPRAKPSKENPEQAIIGNKVASWIVKYITEKNTFDKTVQITFRELDKAFFELGFDLSQL